MARRPRRRWRAAARRRHDAIGLSCLCGRVRLRRARAPEFVNACNCAFCRKSGALWGYFNPAEVAVEGEAAGYRREDKADPAAQLMFCPRCGATTHFVLTEATVAALGDTMVGVNMALADEAALAGMELRFPDGRGWQGKDAFGFVRPPTRIGSHDRS